MFVPMRYILVLSTNLKVYHPYSAFHWAGAVACNGRVHHSNATAASALSRACGKQDRKGSIRWDQFSISSDATESNTAHHTQAQVVDGSEYRLGS